MEALEVRLKLYKDECKEAGKELMISGMKMKSPAGNWISRTSWTFSCRFLLDRMKICQWLKKLLELRTDNLSEVKMKHEYLQYLRVTLQGDYKILTKPFNTSPPDELVPFAECIANKTADAIPDMPRAGGKLCQDFLMTSYWLA